MNELTNIISLVIGDWSGDGHSQSNTIVIKSNLDKKAIEKAYKKGTKKLGFDFIKDIAADYADQNLSKERLDVLLKHGLKTKDLDLDFDLKRKEYEEGPGVNIWHDDYVEIYLFIVKLGNEEFKYELLEGDVNPTIHIGGYGLYE